MRHYRLGLTLSEIGGATNLQGAFAALSRAVELDKTNQAAQLKLGELYLLGNEPAKAREQAEIVLVSAPQNTEGLILKGRSLINEKHYAEGIAELKKAIELDPKNMRTYIELARAHFFAKDTSRGRGDTQTSVDDRPALYGDLACIRRFSRRRPASRTKQKSVTSKRSKSPQKTKTFT